MIELEEVEKGFELYEKVKSIILAKKDNKSFKYDYHQHHLYEEDEYPGISENYYNEEGSVEFENVSGKTIRLEIRRWHFHMHNGYSRLSGLPCLRANIYEISNEEENVLWCLKEEAWRFGYKIVVSDLEIPYEILEEKNNSQIKDIKSTTDISKKLVLK